MCVGQRHVRRGLPRAARRRSATYAGHDRGSQKKFIQRDDDWGFPITTLREHKILLQLRHANLIRLHEVFSPDS